MPQPNEPNGHDLVWQFFGGFGFDEFDVAEDCGYEFQGMEGVWHAAPGDWIVREVTGEFVAMKNDIFTRLYEVID